MEHYQRKNFIINKNFQIRYCVYVCSWLFTLSFVYPFIIYEIFDFFIRYVAFHSPKTSTADLHEIRSQIVFLLSILQLVFLVVTFLISVFVSHRIAGPLYKLSQWLQAGRDGSLRSDLYFRKADYFREVATDYNLMISGIFSRIDRNVIKLEEAAKKADGSTRSTMEKVIEDLKKIREKPIQDSEDDKTGEIHAANSTPIA